MTIPWSIETLKRVSERAGLSCSKLGSIQAQILSSHHMDISESPQTMRAADEREELSLPVPDDCDGRVIGSTLQEDPSEDQSEENRVEGAQSQVAEFVSHMDLASPEVLRVTPACEAFRNCFQALRGAGGDLHFKSHRSDKIGAFWSHSWHGKTWKKILTLVTIYNGQAAIMLGMLVAVVMMVLFCVLGLPDYHRDGNRNTERWSVWSTWSGILVTFLAAIFYRPQTRVFFDRICISQSNRELKLKGVISLAGLLRRSDSMLILWDSTWTTRLWCLFEPRYRPLGVFCTCVRFLSTLVMKTLQSF